MQMAATRRITKTLRSTGAPDSTQRCLPPDCTRPDATVDAVSKGVAVAQVNGDASSPPEWFAGLMEDIRDVQRKLDQEESNQGTVIAKLTELADEVKVVKSRLERL